MRLRVGIREQHVVADRVQRAQPTRARRIQHLHQIEPARAGNGRLPDALEALTALLEGGVAREMVRLAAHVRRALHVVLSAQGIHARTRAPDIAGEQRKVHQAHHALGALHVLGDAEAVYAERGCLARIESRCLADPLGSDAAHWRYALGRPGLDEAAIGLPVRDARRNEVGVDQPFADHRVSQRIQQRDVGARSQLQVQLGLLRQLGATRVDHDQVGTAQRRLANARTHDRVVLGGIGAKHQQCSCALDVVEGAGGGSRAEHRAQRGRARRVAHARAAVHVVGAEHHARELLRQVVVLVGRARRAEHADGVGTVYSEDALQPLGDEARARAPT